MALTAAVAATHGVSADECAKSRSVTQQFYPHYDPYPQIERYGVYTFYGTSGENVWLFCAGDKRTKWGLKIYQPSGTPPKDFSTKAAALAAQIFDVPVETTTKITNDCLKSAENDSKEENAISTQRFVLFCNYNTRFRVTLIYDER